MSQQMEGSRAQVWHGTALQTTGGLVKKDLFMTKDGRLVSAAKRKLALKKSNPLGKYLKIAKKTKGGEFVKMPKGGIPASTLKKIKK